MRWWVVLALGCAPGADRRGSDAAADSAPPDAPAVAPRSAHDPPTVEPATPLPSVPLTCTGGDGPITWTVNGDPWDGAEVPAGVTQAGDRWACASAGVPSEPVVVTPPGGNVLVVLLDDVGVDKVGGYAAHPQPSPTPTIDRLMAEGLTFDAAYAYPSCSPTRAAILTGRSGRRTGVGNGIHLYKDSYSLPLAEMTMAELVAHAPDPYGSAFVGKWHLASRAWPQVLTNPLQQGFDHWVGSVTNLDLSVARAPWPTHYSRWERVVDGEAAWTDRYATVDTTDAAVANITGLRQPWFVHVSYNASHVPLSPVPEQLHSFGAQTGETPDPDRFDAVTEALDRELDRLIAAVDPTTTTVLLLSDNGTTAKMIREPWDPGRGKLTLYEGGTRVPFVAWGALVAEPGSRSDAFVHVTDLFPTLADIAGVRWHDLHFPDGRPRRIDGLSLLPYLVDPDTPSQRELLVTERFAPNGGAPYTTYDEIALQDRTYKYMDTLEGERFFVKEPGRFDEGPDLLEDGEDALDAVQAAALAAFRDQAASIRARIAYDH